MTTDEYVQESQRADLRANEAYRGYKMRAGACSFEQFLETWDYWLAERRADRNARLIAMQAGTYRAGE